MSLAINTTVVRSENGKLLLEEQAGHVKMDVLSPDLVYEAYVEVEAHNDRGHVHIRGADEVQIVQNDNGNSLSSLQFVDGSITFNADQIQISCVNAPIEMNINGTPGAGKVLTCSDSIGTCDWQTPGGGGGGVMLQTKISVTSAQIKAVLTNPLLLLSIPANTRYCHNFMYVQFNPGSVAYTEYDNTDFYTQYWIKYGSIFDGVQYNAIEALLVNMNLLTECFQVGAVSNGMLATPGNFVGADPNIGESIYLVSGGQDLTASAGDGTLDIWLTYSLMAL
jgi:hypothetical protein